MTAQTIIGLIPAAVMLFGPPLWVFFERRRPGRTP